MKETTRRPRQDESAWRGLLARHAESGLSTAAFCAEASVSSKSFYRWRSRVSRSITKPGAVAAMSAKPSATGFIDLGGLRATGTEPVLFRPQERFRCRPAQLGH